MRLKRAEVTIQAGMWAEAVMSSKAPKLGRAQYVQRTARMPEGLEESQR